VAQEAETDFMGACAKHFTERAVGRCGGCGELFCSECLVPPTRKRMPTRVRRGRSPRSTVRDATIQTCAAAAAMSLRCCMPGQVMHDAAS
jgi:hypothetical protein